MKFVDESTIDVLAGKGGDGCLSFRREKFIPRGGPNGGDGGDGGSIFLVVDRHVNTLIHYRHARIHRAENGQPGMGNNKRGKSGEDLYLSVPAGTRVFDEETGELIGDLSRQGQQLCVARGGFHGLGNARYKSSTNRSPRQTTKGSPGDVRRLRLALSVLADVGVLGLPNAGKSTLIHAISNAKPKVADYPFTTLYPMLGVVMVDPVSSFVISDIPGLIEGASSGTGLGVQFLKHLSRCRVLLHVIDVTCPDALASARGILRELEMYSDRLYAKPRWLVLNKIDCLDQAQLAEVKQTITEGLQWDGPVFEMSALQRSGTKALCHAVAQYLETLVTDTDAPVGEDDH